MRPGSSREKLGGCAVVEMLPMFSDVCESRAARVFTCPRAGKEGVAPDASSTEILLTVERTWNPEWEATLRDVASRCLDSDQCHTRASDWHSVVSARSWPGRASALQGVIESMSN